MFMCSTLNCHIEQRNPRAPGGQRFTAKRFDRDVDKFSRQEYRMQTFGYWVCNGMFQDIPIGITIEPTRQAVY